MKPEKRSSKVPELPDRGAHELTVAHVRAWAEDRQGRAQEDKEEAEAAVQIAEGNAKVIRITAEADADAIRLRGEALASFPQILQLEFINRLDTARWLVLPEGTLPVLPFGEQ